MATMSFFTAGHWIMTDSYCSSRQLFLDEDRLKFTVIDATHARLAVYDADDLANEVLPSYLIFELVNGELVGADYGRSSMKFKEHPSIEGWLQYEGDFINPQHQPDEGGDGDPR